MHILEVHLESNDLPATKHFYSEMMGMEIIRESEERLDIKAGHSTLSFLFNPHAKPFYHFAFTIPADQFSEAYDWIRSRVQLLPVEKGSTIAEFTNWNARSFYCYDNNGNILEYIARFDLPYAGLAPFSCSAVVSISEIGLVHRDVAAYCQELKEQYEIDFFSRQPPQPGFSVMGDDEGLLIVVKEGRAWYPTADNAGIFNTYLKVENKGRRFEIHVKDSE